MAAKAIQILHRLSDKELTDIFLQKDSDNTVNEASKQCKCFKEEWNQERHLDLASESNNWNLRDT